MLWLGYVFIPENFCFSFVLFRHVYIYTYIIYILIQLSVDVYKQRPMCSYVYTCIFMAVYNDCAQFCIVGVW